MNLINKVMAAVAGSEPYNTNLVVTNDEVGNIGELVGKIAGWIALIGGALAFIFLLYSGILYVTANGNPEQVKKAQQGILNAIIGMVVIALAYVIFSAVRGTFK